MRIDVMSVLRGVDAFPVLWTRRTTITTQAGTVYELLSLQDLVLAKKTQRDKDWPMIRRLVEAHYTQHATMPAPEQVLFWLKEARTPAILIDVATRFPDRLTEALALRPLLQHALAQNTQALEAALAKEQEEERARDREYWAPLIAELERMRHASQRP